MNGMECRMMVKSIYRWSSWQLKPSTSWTPQLPLYKAGTRRSSARRGKVYDPMRINRVLGDGKAELSAEWEICSPGRSRVRQAGMEQVNGWWQLIKCKGSQSVNTRDQGILFIVYCYGDRYFYRGDPCSLMLQLITPPWQRDRSSVLALVIR